MSESHVGKKQLPHSEETKRKISLANKGRKLSEEHKKRLSIIVRERIKNGKFIISEETKRKFAENRNNQCGEKNPSWKGENVGYSGIHIWVKKWKGIANHCEMCGTTEKRKYHWANIDHKYRRILDDYISMCVPCHRKYDLNIKLLNNYSIR